MKLRNTDNFMSLKKIIFLTLSCAYFMTSLFFGCARSLESTTSLPTDQSRKVDQDWLIMESLAEKMIMPRLNSLKTNSMKIRQAIFKSCDPNSTGEVDMEPLQIFWKQAMFDFHYLEPLMYGPVTINEENSTLRLIYSKPTVGATEFIASQIESADITKENYKMRRPLLHSLGLDALENLFFNIFRDRTSLDPTAGECFYLKYITNNLVEQTEKYESGWLVEERDFLFSLEGKTRLREKISQLSSHIVAYTDQYLKDYRMSAPLGLNQKLYPCDGANDCQRQYLEHAFIEDSKMAIEVPLQALHDLFYSSSAKDKGLSRFGIDSYLRALNVNSDFLQEGSLKSLLRKSKSLAKGSDFSEVFSGQSDLPELIEFLRLLIDVQNFTTWLKTDFLVDMNSTLPQGVQGDND